MADDDDGSIAEARARVELLQKALEIREAAPVRLVETHISWVLLADELAWKLKKPVRLPFLDFTSLASRRRFCEEELRLNRRLAPELYLGVDEVRAGPRGCELGGTGPVLDVALRMRRFADGALWSERLLAGSLAEADVDAFAARLAGFHRDAAVARADASFGSAAARERVTRRIVDAIDVWQAGRQAVDAAWPPLRRWLETERSALDGFWPARQRAGRVRESHGDLHLGNVVQLEEGPTAFDGIEFDDELRWIDVLEDVAFLVMDLTAHGRRDLAFRLLDGWLEVTGDHDGLTGLRFFLVSRALVRAQVSAIGARQGLAGPAGRPTADDYLHLAARLAAQRDPRLAITQGLPGSGKSFVAGRLVEGAGGIRVRSDVERKRLFGLAALQSSSSVAGGIYDADTTSRTYARLQAAARKAVSAGWPTVVDAAFLRRDERQSFATLAASLGAPFSIVHCRAEPAVLRQRLAARQAAGAEASEADAAVLERLMGAEEPLSPAELASAIVVDAARPETAAAACNRWLAARPTHDLGRLSPSGD